MAPCGFAALRRVVSRRGWRKRCPRLVRSSIGAPARRVHPGPRFDRMPKSWNEFSAADWRRLRPLTQAVKTLRYRRIDRTYCRRPAARGDAAAVARSIRGGKALVTVAFRDPELVSWQTRLLRHYVPDARHVVVDNSGTDAATHEICRLVDDAGAAYLRAPP